jgi:hypothetical protein
MIAWFHNSQLLRTDEVPPEWCPWHMNFYCPVCGEVWLKRIHMDEQPRVYVFKSAPCPTCERPQEFWGLPANILNGYETSAGYSPTEIIALEFLSTSGGLKSWTQLPTAN